MATDHNAVTDYGPAIRALGDEPSMASIVGDEVTTRESRSGTSTSSRSPPGQRPFPSRRSPRRRSSPPRAARRRHSQDRPGEPPAHGRHRVLRATALRSGRYRRLEAARAPCRLWTSTPSRSSTATTTPSLDNVERACATGTRSSTPAITRTATGNSDSHKLRLSRGRRSAQFGRDAERRSRRVRRERLRRERARRSRRRLERALHPPRAGGKTVGDTVDAG